MAKFEAVDRLMAMATEKRSDRAPHTSTSVVEELPVASTSHSALAVTPPASSPAETLPPSSEKSQKSTSSAADRGRQILQAIRPLLPGIVGAMRLVDHGAVQALARVLPLLGIGGGSPGGSSPLPYAEHDQVMRDLAALQASDAAQRRDVAELQLQMAGYADESQRLRTQLERFRSEESTRAQELRTLTDRVRLLAASTIILFMLVVAQMILLIMIVHR